MNQNEYDELIDSLVESVTLNYDLNEAFGYYDAIIEVCENCNYYFEYYKAWQLVSFVRFDMYDNNLFDEAEMEVKYNSIHFNDPNYKFDDLIMSYAFHILKTATLKKYNEQVKEKVEA